ncbi:MAG: N-formylglutamate amidohydrolase [Nitrosarchaeum sp.]|nr:N-formylglutamate amidohydrolase [Nitrosarchaeum sp.]
MSKFPVLISIPHGGMGKPSELESSLCITKKDLFDDIDPFVQKIYDLKDSVECVVIADIARTFVDLNRSLQDLPPKNPDGLIKSSTCYQKPIYLKGQEPNESLTKTLIQKYYQPYHRTIQRKINELDLQICLDCHSMASYAPNISPDGNKKKRPMFCLSNQDGKTSSKEMITLLADSIAESFEINSSEIKLNDPFHGGYIIKTYGNNPIPWIQIEMSREMYLLKPWFDEDTLEIESVHLKSLNKKFEKSLKRFFSNIS